MSSDKDVLRDFTLLIFLDIFQGSIAADQKMDGQTHERTSGRWEDEHTKL